MHICFTQPQWVNSVVPERCGCNFNCMTFKNFSGTDIWIISCGTALKQMPWEVTNDESLVQVMTWCHQATSHYLSQCWTRSMSIYDVTRSQWVNAWENELSKNKERLLTSHQLSSLLLAVTHVYCIICFTWCCGYRWVSVVVADDLVLFIARSSSITTMMM